jgi:hypothetical protein
LNRTEINITKAKILSVSLPAWLLRYVTALRQPGKLINYYQCHITNRLVYFEAVCNFLLTTVTIHGASPAAIP